jgi:hypothetical protein
MRQTLAIYRLHAQSKSMSDFSAFGREAKSIRQEYKRYLSRSQRLWLWVVQRHRKARMHGSRVIPLLQEGNYLEATRQFKMAFLTWPLLVVDRGIFIAMRQLAGKNIEMPPVPDLARDWDD